MRTDMEAEAQGERAHDQDLAEFLEQEFLPAVSAGKSETQRRNFLSRHRNAVRAFGTFLQRTPQLSDLATKQLDRFAAWFGEHAPSQKASAPRGCLRSIWRHAAALGVVAPELHEADISGTLQNFLATKPLPNRNCDKPRYHRAVRIFGKFLDRPAMLTDLNSESLRLFGEWIRDHSPRDRANGLPSVLRRIWKQAAAAGVAIPFAEQEKVITDPPGTLLHYLEADFLPVRTAGMQGARLHQERLRFRRAARTFGDCLGRRALLSDLTPAAVKEFSEWLPEHGPKSKITDLMNSLRRVWRHAAAAGVAEPVDEPEKVAAATPGTLRHYLETVYLPVRTKGKRGNRLYQDRVRFRRAVRAFGVCLGRAALLTDLTPAAVKRLAQWLPEHGPKNKAAEVINSVRRVWRHAAAGGVAEPVDEPEKAAAATPGTLRHYLETKFLPVRTEGLRGNRLHQERLRFRRAVRTFGVFLGQPAQLTDLTPAVVQRFAEWVPGNGQSKLGNLRKLLRIVWRHAATDGVAEAIDEPQRRARPERPVGMPGTLLHYFETSYLPLRLVGASAGTIKDYRNKLRQFDRFMGRPVRLDELSDSLLAEFFNYRLAQNVRKTTINGSRIVILAVWRYAVEQGQVLNEPKIRKLRESNDEPDSWSEAEFRAMLSNCDCLAGDHPFGGVPAAALMRAVLLTAYWTGLRRGTLWRLRWTDVDLEGRWVTVPGDIMKGRRGKRFRLGQDAAEALGAIMVADTDAVFPKVDWHRFYAAFAKVLEAAGVPPSRRRGMSKLHKIRRTTATMVAVRQGVGAASALLGHSGTQVTLRYIDPTRMTGNDITSVLPTLTMSPGGVS